MHWRLLDLARACTALGLCLTLTLGSLASAQEAPEPLPDAGDLSETIGLLEARDSGAVEVVASGRGNDRVQLEIRNTSPRRLNVVVPPGLVAAAATGQGFQSIGLGTPGNREGAFGQFQPQGAGASAGFRSIAPAGPEAGAVTVPPDQTIELIVPGVCLNYGIPDPTPRDRFQLMDVSDYSTDPRVGLALRSLATLGTSQPVAQAVMWNVCNGLKFEQMAAATPKKINRLELALAARFVEAMETGNHPGDIVDPAYLTQGRVFVRVQGDEKVAEEAARLAESMEGLHLFGLPVRVVDGSEEPVANGPALYLVVTLTASTDAATSGRVAVKGALRDGSWTDGGTAKLVADAPIGSMDGAMLAGAIDRAVASTFVGVRPVRRNAGGTDLRVENRLPLTLSRVVLRTEAGAPLAFDAMGVGPLRQGEVTIQADSGSVERVEFNGL